MRTCPLNLKLATFDVVTMLKSSASKIAKSTCRNSNATQIPGTGVLAYDERNRLKTVVYTASTRSAGYNARGERVSTSGAPLTGGVGESIAQAKSIGGGCIGSGTSSVFIYSESGALVGNYNMCDATDEDVVYLDATPLARVKDGVIYPLEADHLGSPRVMQKPDGSGTGWTWNLLANSVTGSNAFGEQLPTGKQNFNLRFPGQFADGNGLSYNYFRDYEAGTGRYVESDPIGLRGGISTFGYAASSPGKFIDPSGLSIRCICGQTKSGGVERGLLWGWNKITICSYRCRCFCNSDMPDNIPFDFSEKHSQNTECRIPFPQQGEPAISFDVIEEANSFLPWPVLGGFPDIARDWLPQMEKFCKCKSQACCT